MLIEEYNIKYYYSNFIGRVKEFLAEKDVPSITNIFASFYVIAIFIAIVYIQRKMHLKESE